MQNPFSTTVQITQSLNGTTMTFRWTQPTRFHSYKCEVRINGGEWVRRAGFDATDATIGETLRGVLAT